MNETNVSSGPEPSLRLSRDGTFLRLDDHELRIESFSFFENEALQPWLSSLSDDEWPTWDQWRELQLTALRNLRVEPGYFPRRLQGVFDSCEALCEGMRTSLLNDLIWSLQPQ